MEWLDRMNDALGYLEANLAGTADMEHAARLACCSVYHFGRMFSYIAGVPLSEYLRRRRMTLAAFDLQNGGRVLDVALRYGYESPTAFNRAFQSVHGVSGQRQQRVLFRRPVFYFRPSYGHGRRCVRTAAAVSEAGIL